MKQPICEKEIFFKFLPSLIFVFSPAEAELYVGSQDRIEIKYDMIRLTDEMKMLDGCIIDCRYFDHQWIFIKQRHDRNHPNGSRAVMGKLNIL
jgi:hypothetical protein